MDIVIFLIVLGVIVLIGYGAWKLPGDRTETPAIEDPAGGSHPEEVGSDPVAREVQEAGPDTPSPR